MVYCGQKTLVFWTLLTPLKVIPSLYLAKSTETRYNTQSPGKDIFHKFRYSHKQPLHILTKVCNFPANQPPLYRGLFLCYKESMQLVA